MPDLAHALVRNPQAVLEQYEHDQEPGNEELHGAGSVARSTPREAREPHRRATGNASRPGVSRPRAEQFFDAKQLVVLRHAIRARKRPRLDLRRRSANCDVGDGGVLGFPGTVRDDRGVTRTGCHGDRGQRLGQCSDLVGLDQDRVRDVLGDAARQDLGVRHEQVVADELHLLAEPACQDGPAFPVGLRHAVLDREDRIAFRERSQVVGELLGVELPAFRFELVAAVADETRCSQRRDRARRRAPRGSQPARSPPGSRRARLRWMAGSGRNRPRRRPKLQGRDPAGSSSAGGISLRRSAAPRGNSAVPPARS